MELDPNNQPAPAPVSMVDVFDDQGNKGKIPADQMQTAVNRGFKQAVRVTSPEGQAGWLPIDKVKAAMDQRGFTVGQPLTQTAGDTMVNGKFTPGNPQPTNPFLLESLNKINDATRGTGHVLNVGGKTLLKIAANPAPSGVGNAISEEAMEEQQNGGIPNSKDVVAAPVREFAGVRQPGESATLGFTGHDPSQQGVLTQTANAMDNLMGGDPAAARAHFSQAATHIANNNPQAASDEKQRGYADMLGVPLATVGTSRLLGETPVGPIARKIAPAASNALSAVGDSLNNARAAVAEKVVAPIVRKPLGATLQDTRFGRNPAKAISDEGLVGTQPQLLAKSQARVGELSDAVDQTLQNHANSAVQIDASPIIDNAIDNAASAAKKTGNQAAVTRLENLRTALKTEYGPTQGTPFEMNNLKREIGQVGSDLGAFKSTDPVEASAASAMQDVYAGLKNAVNQQVPEVAPLNERVSNLISAQTALKRNLALDANKSVLSGMSMTNASFKIAEKTISSAPVRTAAARVINAGNTLDVPQVNPIAQTVAPVGRQLGQGAIITPPPVNPSGSVPFNAPPIAATSRAQRLGLILPENATPEPIRLDSGADTSGSAPNAQVPPIAATSRAQRLGLVLPERTSIEAPAVPPQGREGLLPAASRIDPTTGRLQYLTSPAEPGAPAPIARPTQEGPRAIPAAPEPPQSAPVAAQSALERRQTTGSQLRDILDNAKSKMSPEDTTSALFTDEKTGLPNAKAYNIAQPALSATHPHFGFADVDGFKEVNDTLGEPNVDSKVFPAIGDAMRKAVADEKGAVHAFHVHGDEFHFLGSDPAAISRVVGKVNAELENGTFSVQKPDGTIAEVPGIGFSHGTGDTIEAANAAEKLDKAARKAAGKRAGLRDAP